MTPREMLELAAKAAGIAVHHWSHADCPDCPDAVPVLTDGINTEIVVWNPLADDGDALRLAVSLKIDTLHRSEVWATLAGKGLQLSETYNEDPNAATRRAITRAAAEIGRAME